MNSESAVLPQPAASPGDAVLVVAQPAVPLIHIPRHLLVSVLAVSLLVPVAARLAGTLSMGWVWFVDYVGIAAESPIFFLASLLAPALVLFGIGNASRKAPLAFWLAGTGAVAMMVSEHGGLATGAPWTAFFGLLMAPALSCMGAAAGVAAGYALHATIGKEGRRAAIAAALALAALGAGAWEAGQRIAAPVASDLFDVWTIDQQRSPAHLECAKTAI